MKKSAKSKTNQLVSALEIALGNPVECPPAGFRTVRQWAAVWKNSRHAAVHFCESHTASRKMVAKPYRVSVGAKKISVMHYKAV